MMKPEFSAVTLENRYAVMGADVEMTCIISKLISTVSVQWRNAKGEIVNSDDQLTVKQGSKDDNGKQQSTLTISKTELQAMGTTTTTFSCEVLSADQTVAITKTMTLSIYDFSKFSTSVLKFQ